MKSTPSFLAVLALALAGVACGPPRTRPLPATLGRPGGAHFVVGRSTAVTASESPEPETRSDEGPTSAERDDAPVDRRASDGPDGEARGDGSDPTADGASEDGAEGVDPEAGDVTLDPEAGDLAPEDLDGARPAPTRVQAVPSRLPAPLARQDRVFAPEIDNIPDPAWVDPTVLVLARICVSEAGWEGQQDCAGIFQVLRNVRRNDETLMGAMRRASRVVSEIWAPTTARHRWLVGLDLEGNEPAHFPEQADWDAHYRHRWMNVLDHARALIEGRVSTHPCPGAVIAWGGDMDDYLALRRNLVRVDCGETANTFWKRPGPGR